MKKPATREPSEHPAARSRTAARTTTAVISVLLLVVSVLLSLAIGSENYGLGHMLSGLVHGGDDPVALIVRQVRLPRTALGALVGAAMALSGALMQGMTRNPIADSGLLGINAGAAFALVLAVDVFGISSAGSFIWLTMVGAGLATALVLLLAGSRRNRDVLSLVLGGAVVAALLSSFTSVVLVLETRPDNEFLFYQVGSLSGTTPDLVLAVAPFGLAGILLALTRGPALNVMGLGDDVAAALGLRVACQQVVIGVAVALMAGSAVAGAGPIGFLGLAVPHIVQPFTGPDYRWILPISAVTGAAILLLGDVAGRILFQPNELNVGITTAVLGAPILIAIVTRTRLGRT